MRVRDESKHYREQFFLFGLKIQSHGQNKHFGKKFAFYVFTSKEEKKVISFTNEKKHYLEGLSGKTNVKSEL